MMKKDYRFWVGGMNLIVVVEKVVCLLVIMIFNVVRIQYGVIDD